jgi:capsular polysaccharide biosynthesis protein
VVLPSVDQVRTLPRTIEPEVDQNYVTRQVAVQGEKYLAAIHDAKIVGTSGLVILPDGQYASEAVFNRTILEKDPDYVAPPARPTVQKSGNYFSLLVVWSKAGIYYHWLHDTLQRLFAVIERLPGDTQLIVPAKLKPYQLETLRLLGIDEHRLAPFNGDEVWELETLFFTNKTTNSGSHRRDADEWLRDTLSDAYKITRSAERRRLFISRNGLQKRQLVNEAEVVEYLAKFGFETCRPETLSLQEQFELFAQADVVVSKHGSAWTNLLFAPEGTVVVDMIPDHMMHLSYVFWTMCEELGHEYWYFVADSVPGKGKQPDTHVPMDKLALTMERLRLD